jgi:AcrR family transcriptional regulator
MVRQQTPNAGARRAAVLKASAEIFSQQGYRGTTMTDIANGVGLEKPSLYHYFKSKEEILVQLYENVLVEGVANAQAVVDQMLDPLEAYRQLLVGRVVNSCEQRDLFKVFFEEEGELPKHVAKALVERRAGFEEILKSTVAEHLRRTGIELPYSIPVYVNSCLGAANWTYKWFDPRGPLTPAELGAQVADIMITPLRPAKTRRRAPARAN